MADTMNETSPTIRWSPHSRPDNQRFLKIVGRNSRDHELSLFTVSHQNSANARDVKIKLVAKHTKVPFFRCIDWSPCDEDVIAVGQPSGEAILLRISDNTSIPLAAKHQRPCNGVSFNCTGQFLATGLDKVRNDFCLNIWDVNQRLGERVGPNSDTGKPLRQLATSETISSVCFVRDDANVLLTGINYRAIRTWDLRESPNNQLMGICTSRCAIGITLDLDPNYFASYSEDSAVAVWDRRFIRYAGSGEPALNFVRPTDEYGRSGTQIASLRYSCTKQGTFGTLNSGGRLRAYDTAKISDQDPHTVSSLGLYGAPATVASAAAEPDKRSGWGDSAASLLGGGMRNGPVARTQNRRTDGQTLFVTRINDLATTRGSKIERRIVSFDWMSDPQGASRGEVLRTLCLRSDGSVDVIVSSGVATSLAWGSRNGLSITSGKDLKILPPSDSLGIDTVKPDGEGRSVAHKEEASSIVGSPGFGLGMHEKHPAERSDNVVRREDFLLDPAEVLRDDICVVMRRRVEQGYEMDCAKNAGLTEDVYLKNMWMWLRGACESAMDNGMVSGLLDLSYMGVFGIWQGGIGKTQESRLTTAKRPSASDWADTVTEINKRCKREKFKGESQYPEQRILALAICGWDFSANELDQEIRRLEEEGRYSKAAGWAFFHGDIERSIKSLSQGGQQMKLMSTAVAGYHAHAQSTLSSATVDNSDNTNGNIWKDLCHDMSVELDDPYLRSIFAYVSNGDWKDVLDDLGLPIRERLGIALRWLKDSELTKYLTDLTLKLVANGDLDGIVVTGVTEQAINLLQVYINRTGDVQTAALISAFAVPRYFSDDRVSNWHDSYRHLLNSFRLFHSRAKFDCSGKYMYVAQTATGATSGGGGGNIPHTAPGTSATKATVCPHCKKSLPRCAVCLLNLGTVAYKKVAVGLGTSVGGGGGVERDTDRESDYDRWFNFCLACGHGMHAGHAKEWFGLRKVCPVPGCRCQCKM
ncbi:unnamed protein product [Tuber melanosporum]|uniref:(Perigord truffle) hypothetical protein n=1 Tax=Tuber melanosporum (strain Mel28) TaxID=656061 RepID=D5GBM4_TUBMM|nr:uncharacterized protein GSTUM_00005707001 [Tuber melanosporum]CAZ82030.1 unnamed protein product [Tuber melanosporum]